MALYVGWLFYLFTSITANTNAMVEKNLEKEKLTSNKRLDVQLRRIPKNIKRSKQTFQIFVKSSF